MTISIRETLKNVASDKYNKTNIFYFIILSVITTILGSFLPEDPNILLQLNNILLIIFYLLFAFILNGIYMVSLNSAINNKKEIIANIINDIEQITTAGLKSAIGGGIVCILMIILIAIPFAILIYLNVFLGLLVIPLILALGIIYIGLFLNFSVSLKLSEWFSFKKAFYIINLSKNKFSKYVWKISLITILGIICAFIPALILTIIIKLLSIFSIIDPSLCNQIINVITSIVIGIVVGIFSIYSLDLTAEYIKDAKQVNE